MDLKSVIEEVYDVSAEWYVLGIILGISPSRLDTIRHQSFDVQSCLVEVIRTWLGSSRLPPTWGNLIDALKSRTIGKHRLAEELRKKYIPTSTEGNNHSQEIMMVTALHMYFVQ